MDSKSQELDYTETTGYRYRVRKKVGFGMGVQMIKSILLAGVISLFSQNLAAENAGPRTQWLFNWSELLSYHIALDHLREGKCQNHYPKTTAYGGIAAIVMMRDRFPTQLGKLNFMEIAEVTFKVPKVVAAFKFVRESIDERLNSSLDHGDRLSEICFGFIKTYKNLVDNLMPTVETSTNILLKEFPDGFKIGEN